jgi:hypothetical protein
MYCTPFYFHITSSIAFFSMKGTLNETLGLLRIRIVRQSLWTINMDTEYSKRNQGDVAGPVLGGSGTKNPGNRR